MTLRLAGMHRLLPAPRVLAQISPRGRSATNRKPADFFNLETTSINESLVWSSGLSGSPMDAPYGLLFWRTSTYEMSF